MPYGIEMIIKVAATDFGLREPVRGRVRPFGRQRRPAGDGGGLRRGGSPGRRRSRLRKALLEFASSRARLALFHGPLGFCPTAVAPPGYLEAYQTGRKSGGRRTAWLGRDAALGHTRIGRDASGARRRFSPCE